MRTLAIDPGQKRIGLAISDAGGKLANPLKVIDAGSAQAEILRIIQDEDVQRIVVGLPLNMDGSRGPAANQAIQFGRALATRAGKPVVFVDERLSSFAAEESLLNRKKAGEKMTRKGKKARLDSTAACLFLQAYLDGELKEVETERRRDDETKCEDI